MPSPITLTRYKIKRITEAIEAGNYMEPAAALIGISKAGLYKWLSFGKQLRAELEAKVEQHVDVWAIEHQAEINRQRVASGLPPEDEDEEPIIDTLAHIREIGKDHPHWLCVELVDSVEKAKAAAECRAVALIAKAGQEHWQANAWFLERTNHEQWGRKGTIQHVGPNGGPVQMQVASINLDVLVGGMSDEQLEGAMKLVESIFEANAATAIAGPSDASSPA